MLDRIDDLIEVLKRNPAVLARRGIARTDSLYCPACGDYRRMAIVAVSTPKNVVESAEVGTQHRHHKDDFVPSLIAFACVECDTRFTGVIYDSPDGPDVVVLPSIRGGLTTPNTPASVAYYLDQAHRSEITGARSAAVGMYRSALDNLLFEQGYTVRMCGKKLEALEADIAAGKAPKWATDLDTDFLAVLKELGDASLHPNSGDVTTQDALDAEFVRKVRQTFLHVLDVVYEAELKKKERLTALKAKAHELTGGDTSSGKKKS